LPDKAIDVIDEVGASVKLLPASRRPKKVSVQMVENTIARMAKIPPKTVVADEKHRLKTLRDDIKKTIFGQNEAIDAIVDAIQISRCRSRPSRPNLSDHSYFRPDRRQQDQVSKQLAEIPASNSSALT
jgi:ATP-dependent Clp protease ATP-binding subunit ClpA